MTDVQGRCPACRGASLFLGSGGHVTCSRIDCPNPTAADQLLHGEPAATATELQAEVNRLRSGEEGGYAPHTEPTPGQWLRRFNESSTEERLNVITRVLDASARAATCFQMNHEARLADDRKAWVIVARIRDVVDEMEDITGARHWARILRKAINGEQPAPTAAATEATSHIYLSTGCLHGHHDYCQNHTGHSGTKTPAQCKFCSAPCTCGCHQEAGPA